MAAQRVTATAPSGTVVRAARRPADALPAVFFAGPGTPSSPFRFPETRGAERRGALVRNAAPFGPPCGRADLRIAGDHRPNDAGRRAFRRSTAAFLAKLSLRRSSG